ncbi:MAG: LAGLIDADG family homing endonuclease [bacterium]
MKSQKFNVANLVNNYGCFDLQFRKDTRHERTNSPTYYRWKAQFVVTAPKSNLKILEKIKKEINCGKVYASGGQARFSVQKICDIYDVILPYFRKNQLKDKKKKDFDLWSKAIETIYKNKGKNLVNWKKNEINQLIQIQKSCAKYKNNPRSCKWLEMAKTLTKTS